ncbi:MAG: hypothetical protein SPJ13_04575 [Bacteroidales bacterium]|nr:hypothetical protein [Bacteroidales bacterium]
MRKKLSIMAILAIGTMMATSCVKDVITLVQNPLWLHADFNPTLGVPLAYGELSLSDLMHMMKRQPDYFKITYDETTDLVTLSYDSTFHDHIETGGAKEGDFVALDQPFPQKGSINITLFDQVEGFPDSTQLKLQNVFLDLLCHVSADMQDDAVAAIARHNAKLYLSDVMVTALDGDNNPFTVKSLSDTIWLTELAHGNTVHARIFNNEDVAFILNHKPRQMTYNLALHVVIPKYSSVMPIMQFIRDSLGINTFDINTDVSVRFPVTGRINGLIYDNNLKMKVGDIDNENISIDTALLVLDLENSLPIALALQASLVDEAGNELCQLFEDTQYDTIPGATLRWNAATNSYVSDQPISRRHFITLNKRRFEALQRTSSLRLKTIANTSTQGADGSTIDDAVVTLRGNDQLRVRAYLLAQPQLTMDTVVNL